MLGAEIAAYLAAANYGTVNTDIFFNFTPPDPDAITVIQQYGGTGDEPDMLNGGKTTRLEYPRFQVLRRGAPRDNVGPELVIVQIRATLVAVGGITLSGVRYVSIDAIGPPMPLDEDEIFRISWVCSFQAMKSPSTS